MKPDPLDLKVAWRITSMVSLTLVAGGYGCGKALECKPDQIDGQCGLSTFLGLVYGVVPGLSLFLISTVCFALIAYRRRIVSRRGSK